MRPLESRLAVGVIGSVPDVNQVPFVEEIPLAGISSQSGIQQESRLRMSVVKVGSAGEATDYASAGW